ncbi:hypothetical protein LTR53_010288 [Teratosphaeriaceae sp. CCFEE 6253]|nr:hypothetical protein LTR53_010288 [Teratosphaeriaceae sp. CCFEE 6253]
MSEYNKPAAYDDVYEYNATTRSEHGQDQANLGAQQTYASQYVDTRAQVPSGPPHSTALSMVPAVPRYRDPHDPLYNPPAQHDQQYPQQPAYLEPRQAPEILSFVPTSGYQGYQVTVRFRSIYDFESPPIQAFMMFGTHRCRSTLNKTNQQNEMYYYDLTAEAPPLPLTNSPSPTPLHLVFDDSLVQWSSPSLEFGHFAYLNAALYDYPSDPPQGTARKRKLSPEASPRRSPTKKASYAQFDGPSRTLTEPYTEPLPMISQSPAYRRPSLPETYLQPRRMSSDYHTSFSTPAYSAPLPVTPHYYSRPIQGAQSQSWAYQPPGGLGVTRSPSTAAVSTGGRSSHLLPTPAGSTPPLVRTSTLQQSPTTPASTIATFNPYAIYPSNAKANLAIEGELATMADNWTEAEWEARRRLVQFSRSQTGSVITAKFEVVTPEARAPNSICVSCILWAEKNECYVTSVDTIQLLEALVAVRFTVEEKNRIRRNLEGFRPATVSKAKPDSEDFFKLIMGFPSPKPRNIEKDVKVFPWRILATALKKIIGKYASHSRPRLHNASCTMQDAAYPAPLLAVADHASLLQSASYSSTAGALHTPGAGPSYTTGRGSNEGLAAESAQVQQLQRPIGASPRSTSSSVTSHAAYAPSHSITTTNTYSPHASGAFSSAGLGIGSSAGQIPDLRMAVPGAVAAASQTTSWHQPSAHYLEMAAPQSQNRGTWDYNTYLSNSPATGLPGSAPPYIYPPQQQHVRLPSFTAQPPMATEARFVPLHDYEDQSQPTTTA